jgi:signal transduction histidine kinase
MQLTEHPFLQSLGAEALKELADGATLLELPPEAIVFEEGSPSDCLCLVLEGRVDFVKAAANGQKLVISHTSEGTFFGEIGLFTDTGRSMTAVAHGPVHLAKIHREQLITFIKNTPGPIEQILGSIVHHLNDTTSHYVDDMLYQEKMSLVGTMMNSILHDFKNPFTMISLGAQMIAKRSNDDAKVQKLCGNILEQIDRMLQMANEVSEFSRGEARQLDWQAVCLDDLAAQFYTLNEPFFNHERVQLEMDVEPITITADPAKLLRVLQNLVGNAIEAYGREGTGTVCVALKPSGPNQVVFQIEDDAGGIPEAIRETLFEPFVTYGKSKGTGLGSAIVKNLIEAHGGSITFTTQTGVGTCFKAVFPQHPSPEASDPLSAET